MIDFLQHLFAFIFALGLLVTFHEFGHFWVARKCDVKILRFSIGFGKPLWVRHFGQDKSELVIATLPLGGYVRMLDEREGNVSRHELDRAFNRKSLAQRSAIVIAGPVCNFLFAIFVFWLMFMIGLTGLKPIVGDVKNGSIGYQAGLEKGVEIIAVDSQETNTWTMVVDAFISRIIDGSKVDITVRDNSVVKILTINFEGVSIDDLAEQGLLNKLGITPKQFKVPAIIGDVHSGLPADEAGLIAGDLIISANGDQVDDWMKWVEYVQAYPDQKITVEIEREHKYLTLELTPNKKVEDNGRIIGFIGAASQPVDAMLTKESYTLIPALFRAVERTWDMSWLTLRILGKMITGQASLKNLSGPISIAQYAGDSAQSGIAAFLWFLGIVSVSLGVLNLLPIPLLDGGHLLYYIVEFFKGSVVSESTQIIGQQVGFTLLLGLIVLVFYNDIVRLMG